MVAFSKPERMPLNADSYPKWTKAGGIDKQDFPRIVHPSVYVLLLEDEKYYVGLATHGSEFRIGEHCGNMGSKWTQQYEPLHVIDYYYPASKKLEKEVTIYYAHKYGAANVRGGPYCCGPPPAPMQPELPAILQPPSDPLASQSNTAQASVDLERTVSVAHGPTNHADDHVREYPPLVQQ